MFRVILGIGLLVVRFSACISPPQMTRYIEYNGSPKKILELSKQILDSLDYEIDWYTPEGNILVTKPIFVQHDIRKYQYAVIIHVEDVVEIILIAQKSVFKRGSEWSIGGKELTSLEEKDRIPYGLQQKIFFPLLGSYEKIGCFEFDRETGKRKKRNINNL